MKMEKNLKQNWTDGQIEHLAVTGLKTGTGRTGITVHGHTEASEPDRTVCRMQI